ncbi:MAG: tRNA uridine-5-carboxymethylaminomethyl(34) synthesis enzyme MnmG [Victivallaceae bacterium]|nr:tRNA uridine-5-carboxymethylaminomethyl(34) synthesis enzyme MnmG [Victivallaceae bacterium]
MKIYDVIVIGAGHAGCEAALAAARQGASTLILTGNMDHIAQLSCNPAIGGIAKGQLTREIDALGGAQGMVADLAAVQFRLLNRSKGPAVWSPRAQCDKVCFQRAMKMVLEQQPDLDIKQDIASSFIIDHKDNVTGIKTQLGEKILAKSVVIATGTFLSGLMHFGMTSLPGGRTGDPSSEELALALREQLQLRIGRLKTGTPPRILAKTIDFSQMKTQSAEAEDEGFSHFELPPALPRTIHREMPCYMVYSTNETAELAKANIHLAPLFQGKIQGIGARYCPSFEDKVMRFPHHEKHLLYLEPEGEFTGEYYINGISTSLPPEIQNKMLKTIPGLEKSVISRYAYAIEYDFIFPDQIERTLALKRWRNVFPAGQINGTSGYEEAGGQGLLAGLNAARTAAGLEPVVIPRELSYLGVMVDDLVTKDIIEPYRLFTSRSEYRLRLRQDNADLRLCELAKELNLLPLDKYRSYVEYNTQLNDAIALSKSVKCQGKTIFAQLKSLRGIYYENTPLPCSIDGMNLDLKTRNGRKIIRQLAILAHYEGYLEREEQSIGKLQKLENWKISADFDYNSLSGLCNESKAKLNKVRPTTLAQASRIDGVTPVEIALLQVSLTRISKSAGR